MNYKIIHETTYLFDGDVFLEPHYLRFRPKQTPFIDVTHFSISLKSAPQGHSIIEDEEHNTIDFCWFETLTNRLTIHVESYLETKDHNPFNFIIHPDSFNTLPFTYSEHQYQILFASLQKQALNQELLDYANTILDAAQCNTVAFVTNLTTQIHQDFIVEYRESGPPMSPNQTFKLKRGSCRDLTWMQINILRNHGIAARFVSGYFYFDMEKPIYELHAWVEVFIPGTGWLGFDPSHGMLTGNTHFSVASSAIAENTMPVSGGIRGSATSQLLTQLTIEKQ
ncbi:MAG: transglutaminase family protein [Alteromonadaceae bacterium]|jgi:transglutaminase-like putative cysteine protease|uniref:Transglutaminase domain protein n=1 Tax=Paraglaciecola mesophila KMM 241 TaxID=1128912 RepID=K6ZSJ1_9ALTE|nr:transglutaminase family protein [Paraglaciecola mesophila]MAD15064.1 transglutaminase family protein [Alteromonadaceae bacterium]MBB18835.1 transglutaminase family protein [Rickettsiales bacterium]GAC26280.1 transglutaminase domain protein [Paraglaciecola mesophila KMM 241]|tara:strand:+ start:5050 stop:5892 length:843 start_codon:yes stop_codon:yes gene_type:complete